MTMAVGARAPEIRMQSAVLSMYPWISDFVLQARERISVDPAYGTFLDTMMKLERQLYNGAGSLEAMDAQRALVIIQPGMTSFPNTDGLTPSATKNLCSMLVAYRLMDVIYALQFPEPSSESFHNPRYKPTARVGSPPADKYWPLEDWVQTLKDGQKYREHMCNFRSEVSAPRKQVAGGAGELGMQAVLFKALAAAFHLSFLLKGYTTNDSLAIPNIPDKSDTLYDIVKQTDFLTNDETMHLQKYLAVNELYRLRHPLQAALLFSPLYLLSGRRILHNAWDQSSMMQLSKAFGNMKPNTLRRIELQLWTALLNVATGRDTMFQAMGTFFDGIPQSIESDVPVTDRDFYSTMKLPHVGKLPLASSLLCAEGECTVSPNWPLVELRRPIIRRTPSAVGSSASETGSNESGRSHSLHRNEEHDSQVESDGGDAEADDKRMEVTPQETEEDEQNSMDVDEGERPKKKTRKRKPWKTDTPRRSNRLANEQTKSYLGKGNNSPRKRGKYPTKPIVPFQRIGDLYLQPMDVNEHMHEMQVTFDPSPDRQRVKGEEITLIDPLGMPHLRQPEFHFQGDLEKFEAFRDLVKSCNAPNGEPRYLVPGYQSRVEVMTHTDYQKLSVTEVQEKLRLRHLVITGLQIEQVDGPIAFDASGLQELTNLDSKIYIQDQSVPVSNGDLTVQLRIGTPEHILQMAQDPDGAIINGLSFPLPLSAIKRDKLSSDVEAWRLTEGLPFCTDKAVYPTANMRWGLASTAGSRHWTHIDCDGLATYVDVAAGEKWWILCNAHLDNEPDSSAHSDLFLDDFDPSIAVKTWDAEAVLLTPGTRLIMKPNTPHAVFTTKHTIALGGHFYSFANLQDTVSGIIHCFALDNIITNTEHPETRLLLFRMLEYLHKFTVKGADAQKNQAKHLPDFMNFISLVDVLALCNYCILANVLDYNTYQFPDSKGKKLTASQLRMRTRYDYNALSPLKRRHFTYIRGLAVNLVYWLDCHYEITVGEGEVLDPNETPLIRLWRRYLIAQAYGILYYKRKAEDQKLPGIINCKAADVERQLQLLFDSKTTYLPKGVDFCKPIASSHASFAFTDYGRQVSKVAEPYHHLDMNPAETGVTKGDELFWEGTDSGFPTGRSKANIDDDEAREGPAQEDEDMRDGTVGAIVGIVGEKRKRAV